MKKRKTPIDILPDDVLSSVFLMVLDELGETARPHPSVTMSHVCRHWRQLALGTPLLWSYVDVQPPNYPALLKYRGHWRALKSGSGQIYNIHRVEVATWRRALEAYTARVLTWLSRSGVSPLTVKFVARDPHGFGTMKIPIPGEAEGCYETLTDILGQTTRRWKEASFSVDMAPWTASIRILSTVEGADFPLLEKLELDIGIDRGMEQGSFKFHELGVLKAPNLKSLSIPRVCYGINDLPIQWDTMTELEFGPPPGANERELLSHRFTSLDALEVLRRCGNGILTKVRFNFQSYHMGGWESDHIPAGANARGDKVLLSRLESVTLQNPPSPLALAAFVDVPSLRRLCILGGGLAGPADSERSCAYDWISTFGATLEDVTLDSASLTQTCLQECLEKMRNVVKLSIRCHNEPSEEHWGWQPHGAILTKEMLLRLTPKATPNSGAVISASTETTELYCPNLQYFSVTLGAGPSGFKEEDLAWFVAGRRRSLHVAPLKRVDCRFVGAPKVNVRRVLEILKVDMTGCELNVSYIAPTVE